MNSFEKDMNLLRKWIKQTKELYAILVKFNKLLEKLDGVEKKNVKK